MSSSVWFLLAALLGLCFTFNAAFPRRGPRLLVPSWIAAFLTIDLPFHHIAWQALSLPVWAWFGAFETVYGQLGLLLLFISWLGMVRIWWPALNAQAMVDGVAEQWQLEAVERIPRSYLFKPFSRLRPGVECLRDIEFCQVNGKTLKLDILRPQQLGKGRPILLYLHGGGWMYGDKKDQGLPLCNHMASLGWVCFNANYRLAPAATWPEPLVDAKTAIAWIREHAHEYGADASFVAIAGGSAGGHIASMAALMANDAATQPGFESSDTGIQAALPSYACFDLINRNGLHNPEYVSHFVGPKLMKAKLEEEPEKFAAASPLDQVDRASQPWLIMHGEADSLVPVGEGRDYASVLQASSSNAVLYAEFPAAQHAFDMYYCHRSLAAVDLAARFLVTAYKRGVQAKPD